MNRLQYHICHGVCMPPFLDLKSKHEAVNRLLSTRYWCFVSGVGRTLVFVEQKRQADFLASYLSQMELPTTSIHGYCLLSVLLLVSLTIFLFFLLVLCYPSNEGSRLAACYVGSVLFIIILHSSFSSDSNSMLFVGSNLICFPLLLAIVACVYYYTHQGNPIIFYCSSCTVFRDYTVFYED